MYSREVLAGLAQLHPEAQFLHCYRPHRLWRGLTEPRPRVAACRPLFENIQVWRANLFHGLNQRLPQRTAKRTVCTFHDLFVMSGEYSTTEFRQRFTEQAKQAAARADLIIAVSGFTASQVESYLGFDRARIRVVPHGVRFRLDPGGDSRDPIVLHVGALQVRKNLLRLISAFERVARSPWRLVLAGSDGFGAEQIHARIAASPAQERIKVTGWVSDSELTGWYRRASVLAFASLDEGFGIPALEAMAQGVAVLSSRGSALEEVCGDAALLVDPGSEDEIATGLRRLIEEEALRNRLVTLGRSRASAFPWQRAVESTWRVYEELL